MSITDVIKILENYSIPCTFSHFNKPVTPPFMVYLIDSSDNVDADNKVYYQIEGIRLELYTRVDTIKIEKELEAYLTENGILWDKSAQTWIDEDKLIETVYNLG